MYSRFAATVRCRPPSIFLARPPKFSAFFKGIQLSLVRKQSTGQAPNTTAALLLQKNLVHRNNTIYGYGSGTIRCTVFDSQGNTGTPSVKLKKEDLVLQHGLLPRDLRKIERSKKNDLVPTLLVRKDSILISLLAIKALIKSDMVIFFDSTGTNITLGSNIQKHFLNTVKMKLKNDNANELVAERLPYEFRVLEAIFISAISNLSIEMITLLNNADAVVSELESQITRDKLRLLLVQNKKLSIFYRKAILVRSLLDDLLERDDVLCEMYLTDRKNGVRRTNDDHPEIEMLLETYYSHIDEIVQKTERSIRNIKTTEEIINIILDSNRNQLMLLGIQFSIGLFSLGGILFIGSIYGMNLENFIEETDYGYFLVVSTGVLSTAILYFFATRRLRSLQKMSLMNSLKKPPKT